MFASAHSTIENDAFEIGLLPFENNESPIYAISISKFPEGLTCCRRMNTKNERIPGQDFQHEEHVGKLVLEDIAFFQLSFFVSDNEVFWRKSRIRVSGIVVMRNLETVVLCSTTKTYRGEGRLAEDHDRKY
jgi:hypothetical protein